MILTFTGTKADAAQHIIDNTSLYGLALGAPWPLTERHEDGALVLTAAEDGAGWGYSSGEVVLLRALAAISHGRGISPGNLTALDPGTAAVVVEAIAIAAGIPLASEGRHKADVA
jgi:hypothetical protein